MRLGILINDIETEKPQYTTTNVALEALRRGHEVFYIGVEDFGYDPTERVTMHARSVPKKAEPKDLKELIGLLRGDDAHEQRMWVDGLDALMLRNDPAADAGQPWKQTAGILFGQLAARQGVIVVNDPHGLAKALNKLYFQLFPEELRPRTLITRDPEEIRSFVEELGGDAVLKPLQGSGGRNVFAVRDGDLSNLNQIVETIAREGYVVVQEFLAEAAEKGDLRLFLMNGRPLVVDGKHCAYRRVSETGDLRSNLTAGGKVRRAKITDVHLEIAELVRPKLIQDGMFLVGLDIVGDKLMEVNVFSPGGVGGAMMLEKVNFAAAVVEALERKVSWRSRYQGGFANVELATI